LHSLGEEVAKVKKRTGVTGERNVKGKAKPKGGSGTSKQKNGKASRPAKGRSDRAGKATMKKALRISSRSRVLPVRKTAKGRTAAAASTKAPAQRVAIKPLDPLRKCGPNTSVQLLYRVDESVDGRSTAHLVFFDRHGWYCEHGRTCPAVGHAKKYNGQIARVS
jgi:hypothetical protein